MDSQVFFNLIIILATFVFGFIVAIILYRNPKTRKIKVVSKFFSIESEKFREILKNDFNITKLEIVDSGGKKVKKPYKLKTGTNIFGCVATYTDGTKVEYAPYWLCWQSSAQDPMGVLGTNKKKEVTITCGRNHEKYTELSCWVFPPEKSKSNTHIPMDSLSFIYPKFD